MTHTIETLRRRRRLSNTWAGMVIAWSLVRTLIVWAAVGDYGVNPWIYLAIDLASSVVLAFSTPRLVLRFIDSDFRSAAFWAGISLVAFLVPDLYIFEGSRTLPTRIIVGLCLIIAVSLIASALAIVRKIRAASVERARAAAGGTDQTNALRSSSADWATASPPAGIATVNE